MHLDNCTATIYVIISTEGWEEMVDLLRFLTHLIVKFSLSDVPLAAPVLGTIDARSAASVGEDHRKPLAPKKTKPRTDIKDAYHGQADNCW